MSEPKRVLVAIDLSVGADEAVRGGARRAGELQGLLGIVHVAGPGERLSGAEQPLRAHVAELVGSSPFELFIDSGRADAAIVGRAREWNAELVVLGAGHRSSVSHILAASPSVSRGARIARCSWCAPRNDTAPSLLPRTSPNAVDVIEQVVHRAPCSVLVVRAPS